MSGGGQRRAWRVVGALLLLAVLCLPTALASAGIVASTQLSRAGTVKLGDRAVHGQDGWQRQDTAEFEADLDCAFYTNADRLPPGVTAMVSTGVVVRFDLSDEKRTGPFGVSIGEAEATARARLPEDTIVSTHEYGAEPGDHYLTWRDPADDSALRVETTDRTVTAIYWGRWPAVQQIEGCL